VVNVLAPTSGPENGGTSVAVSGAGFAQDVSGAPQTTIAFGANAASVTCSSATSCVAVSPSGTGTVAVSAAVGGEISGGGPNFTYTASNRVGWLHWHSDKSATLQELSQILLTYDPARKSILLFGAISIIDPAPPETWTWNDKSSWLELSPATSPLMGTGLAFSGNSTAVLFGGIRRVGRFGHVLIDSTSLWDGSNWSAVAPAVRPPARLGESMAFDAARGKLVLFGGCPKIGCDDPPLFNDTWTWDGQAWTQEHPLNAPSPRGGASMAFNPADNTIVLFGGQDSINHALGDTWIWNGSNWIQQQPAATPGPRAHAGLAFHPALRGLLLFGGDLPQLALDTWSWDGATWKQVVTTGGPQAEPLAMVYDEDLQSIFLLDTDREAWTWGGP